MHLKRESIMIRKCVGCGLELQSDDKNLAGYVTLKRLEDADYCERCFKVIHYGEAKVIDTKLDIDDFINKVSNNRCPVIYLLDVITLSHETLNIIKKIKNDLYLVITKRDLLPKSVKDKKIINYVSKDIDNLKYVVFVSSTKKWNIDLLYNKLVKDGVKKCYVLGHTNSGKSSLINSLLEYKGKNALITTSPVPNTTLEVMNIKLDENLTIIDTPGFVNNHAIVNFMDINKYKNVIPRKEIKPKIYRLKPGFMIIIEDIIRIENNSLDNVQMIFYLKNELVYRKMKIVTSNDLKILFRKDYSVSESEDLVIEGLGFIKFPRGGNITIYHLDEKVISKREKLV